MATLLHARVGHFSNDLAYLSLDFRSEIRELRLSFAHEQEVRAVLHRIGDGVREYADLGLKIHTAGLPAEGVDIPVDLDNLLERIYVSPASAPWFVGVVKAVLRQFNAKAHVVNSQLDSDPIY
jgi:hypothetical protein